MPPRAPPRSRPTFRTKWETCVAVEGRAKGESIQSKLPQHLGLTPQNYTLKWRPRHYDFLVYVNCGLGH
eukprot:gene9854-1873_t